jgi:hypothetical protein
MVASIDALHIPHYEIILLGPSYEFPHILSTGHVRQRGTMEWLPGKKNLISMLANFNVICYAHDYFMFDGEWYNEYVKYGTEWDVCSNPQFLIDGNRHPTDWVTWDHPKYGRYYSLDYYDVMQTKYQYISGGYFLVKRDFMRDHPMNESMLPGSPEDVEWSLRIRDIADIKCNPNALVRHNKKHRDVGNMSFPLYQKNVLHL